jgi:hypothetical protein
MKSFSKLALLALAGCAAPGPESSATAVKKPMVAPRYTAAGELVRPTGYESWVLAGASIGLAYSEGAKSDGPGVFHNVYMQPEAYEDYARTGRFPEKTMFVLALYEPRQRESINRQGYFEGNLVAVEASVKDHDRFPEGWAYFDFGKEGGRPSASAKPPSDCHTCHAQHAAVDNVFVQFYPALRKLGSAPLFGS